MPEPRKRYLTRQDIADLLEVSRDVVAHNETRWHLSPYRVRSPRGGHAEVRFNRKETLQRLREWGFLIP